MPNAYSKHEAPIIKNDDKRRAFRHVAVECLQTLVLRKYECYRIATTEKSNLAILLLVRLYLARNAGAASKELALPHGSKLPNSRPMEKEETYVRLKRLELEP